LIGRARPRTATTQRSDTEDRSELVSAPRRLGAPVRSGEPRVTIGKGERVVLSAIAQHHTGVSSDQLAVLTGYRRSTRNTYVQRLREAGLVERNGDGSVRATAAGVESLGDDYTPLPTGRALRQHWDERLTGGERVLFRLIIEAYPDEVAAEDLGEKTEYARSSRNTFLQRLTALKLVRRAGRGWVRAADELFA